MSIKQKRQLIDHEFEEINEIRKLKKAELEFETNGKSESAITEVIHLKLEHSSVAKRIKYYESSKVLIIYYCKCSIRIVCNTKRVFVLHQFFMINNGSIKIYLKIF